MYLSVATVGTYKYTIWLMNIVKLFAKAEAALTRKKAQKLIRKYDKKQLKKNSPKWNLFKNLPH